MPEVDGEVTRYTSLAGSADGGVIAYSALMCTWDVELNLINGQLRAVPVAESYAPLAAAW